MAFRRRGAPFTFDAEAFVEAVKSLQSCFVTRKEDPRLALRFPSFDHAIQDPVQDDIYVQSSARVVIVEGNYLLLDERPWNEAVTLFDEKYELELGGYGRLLTPYRWFVDVPPSIAKSRLVVRHLRAGIEKDVEAAAQRVEDNDLQNGIMIRSRLIPPDVTITNSGETSRIRLGKEDPPNPLGCQGQCETKGGAGGRQV
jgi:pantothenate kinase